VFVFLNVNININVSFPSAGDLTAVYHVVRFWRVFVARRIEGKEMWEIALQQRKVGCLHSIQTAPVDGLFSWLLRRTSVPYSQLICNSVYFASCIHSFRLERRELLLCVYRSGPPSTCAHPLSLITTATKLANGCGCCGTVLHVPLA